MFKSKEQKEKEYREQLLGEARTEAREELREYHTKVMKETQDDSEKARKEIEQYRRDVDAFLEEHRNTIFFEKLKELSKFNKKV